MITLEFTSAAWIQKKNFEIHQKYKEQTLFKSIIDQKLNFLGVYNVFKYKRKPRKLTLICVKQKIRVKIEKFNKKRKI